MAHRSSAVFARQPKQFNYGLPFDYCTPKADPVWQHTKETMANKKKPKRFRAVEAVKAMARERIGEPPASRVLPNRKKTGQEKHKPTLDKLLSEPDSH